MIYTFWISLASQEIQIALYSLWPDLTDPKMNQKDLRSVAITKDDIDEWIGLRENLQESIDFPIKYGVFL